MAKDPPGRIPVFCPLCTSRCGCEAVVQNGRLVALEPDPSHPTGKALCAKGTVMSRRRCVTTWRPAGSHQRCCVASRAGSASRTRLSTNNTVRMVSPRISGKLEIFSARLQQLGQPSLPDYREPAHSAARRGDVHRQYPLVLTSAKTPLYCHSQHRNLVPLRRLLPDPSVEMSPTTAASEGVGAGDWVAIVTPKGRVRARARLTPSLADGVVAAQHGSWQSCPDLNLPGYDLLSPDGANINLVIGNEAFDPVSGAAPQRAYCYRIERLGEATAIARG